ncbi:amino acid aminotransferase [Candidatus Pandoraea novymonadis]|uniref:Aminotransferase n=1 Tax=Candidatus Pandoraea novymonadis TaxID=1808959 RepID=A0ABX5FED6_9BURK|nr:amino acid aminotransferase [Candidatus Pandoraea novymonadis]PSB92078.1 Aromatic-amino-acid aminotransferase [Candidatus Pandoraea novymonadis]
MKLFSSVELAPHDPILGLNEAFNADNRPNKVNLGVGVYFDSNGKLPLLRAVQEAEKQRIAARLPRGYLPIEGIAAYNVAVQQILFGKDSNLLAEKRVVTVQTLGGTGALKIGADFLKQLNPNVNVAISDPSWENHRALFSSVGFNVISYPYYDPHTHGVNLSNMLDMLDKESPGTIVVLHACCHNPTGVDLSLEQWAQVLEVIKKRNLVPFIDIAYQGFGDGIDADAAVIRLFAKSELNFFISSSFSKSFSLYGERVGALSIVTRSNDESTRVLSQLKCVIRTNYSNPPTHGAAVVSSVLGTPELRTMWEDELTQMRQRIHSMRLSIVERLLSQDGDRDFSFVIQQRGMFSYSGLSADQVERLREKFGIYAVSTGRICVATLNEKNIDYVASSIAQVIR